MRKPGLLTGLFLSLLFAAWLLTTRHLSIGLLTARHHTAAAKLIGKLSDLLSIDSDGTAVELALTVIVECGLCSDIDLAAVDDQVAVGIEGIGIALTHVDGHGTAIDGDGRCYT